MNNQMRLRVPGSLPVSPTNYVQTPVTRRIRIAAETAIASGGIAAISGPAGVGKTTASAIVAAEFDTQVAYVGITSKQSPRQNFLSIWEAVTGIPGQGTAVNIQSDLVDHLMSYPTTMVIDDAHQIQADGLRLLTGLWNQVRNAQTEGTPIILVGNDLTRKLAVVPELVSRFRSQYVARYLRINEVLDILGHLEPRTKSIDNQLLRDLDKAYFHGEIRQWAFFLEDLNKIAPGDPDAPFTGAHINEAIQRAGHKAIKRSRTK